VYGSNNIVSGTTVVHSLQSGSFNSAFYNYTVYDNLNSRAGIIVATWRDQNIKFNETTTTDVGNTTDVSFDMFVSNAGDIQLKVNSTANWSFKTMATFI
jgi:hypothetical protein